jgi:hypothetical protein
MENYTSFCLKCRQSITDAFFSNVFSHITNKYHTEDRKVIAISTRSIRNKRAFQIYVTDSETFLISSAPG